MTYIVREVKILPGRGVGGLVLTQRQRSLYITLLLYLISPKRQAQKFRLLSRNSSEVLEAGPSPGLSEAWSTTDIGAPMLNMNCQA